MFVLCEAPQPRQANALPLRLPYTVSGRYTLLMGTTCEGSVEARGEASPFGDTDPIEGTPLFHVLVTWFLQPGPSR